jgi:hypothetical protein
VNAERIEQARRFGGELCAIDSWRGPCAELGTVEHVREHLAAVDMLEEIRQSIDAQSVSYGELAALADLAEYIGPGDVELAEWAGIPESEFVNR